MSVLTNCELVEIASRDDLAETGGSHNQKGIEFQRHWSVLRMFELADTATDDFLFLFEAVQDVSVLDSSTTPTRICVYQIKKKDRKEWSWTELTSLHQPGSSRSDKKRLSKISGSPLGKLYATIHAFKQLASTGSFVSNAGCQVLLHDGTSAATSLPSALSTLSPAHLHLLTEGLATLHTKGETPSDLSRIHLERTVLSVDDPGTHLVGAAHAFLLKRSPPHAGQARSLVDALLMKISPLGARTEHCKTFEEMKLHRGYSKLEFDQALGSLQSIPDVNSYLETWLAQLLAEGGGFLQITSIRAAETAIYRRQVMGSRSLDEDKLIASCDAWLSGKSDPIVLKPFFDEAYTHFHLSFPNISKAELLAHVAIRAILKCVDQT